MNTNIEDSIISAIQLIADDAVANANYDKTVKGQIVKCKDKTTGKYVIKYKDIEQDAYAINPSIKYVKDQYVFITIPKNDGDAVKTILGPVDHVVTTVDLQKETSLLYNAKGPNLLMKTLEYDFSSYLNNNIKVYSKEDNDLNNRIILNDKIKDYISKGNSIILKMNVQTTLEPVQRASGQYGIIYNMIFSDEGTEKEIKKSYKISQMDVIGNPYGLDRETIVSHLEIVDGKNFKEIESIEIFCQGFPIQDDEKTEIKDVHISQVSLQGAVVLNEELLTGYSVNVDYSTAGDSFNDDKNITELLLKGIMKLKGSPISTGVKYYWFRENGIVFQGKKGYSSVGGNGWECLNPYKNLTYVGVSDNRIYFTNKKSNEHYINYISLIQGGQKEKEKPITIFDNTSKTIKIKCVAIYNQSIEATGEITIYNDNINNDLIYITSSDGDKREYYYNNGSPDLTCHVRDDEGLDLVFRNDDDEHTWKTGLKYDWHFIWSIENADGTILKTSADGALSAFYRVQKEYLRVEDILKRTETRSQNAYENTLEYQNAVLNYESQKNTEIIDRDSYYHVDIGSIKNYSKIICGVEKRLAGSTDDYTYVGTASITLYNHMTSKGEYTLSFINGSQVFQYDDDGRSPCLTQRLRPFEILPLSFVLTDNQGEQINFDKIIKNGQVYWCVPKTNTLLVRKLDDSQSAESYMTLTGTVRALAANDTYAIYKNLESFSYSIVDTFDSKKTNNNIRLYIIYKDMIFDIFTNFVFPKSGDPGTNGTPYYAKIWPVDDNNNLLTTDRVYIKWIGENSYDFYTDTGLAVNDLGFRLYDNANNNTPIVTAASKWVCPIKNTNSYFKIDSGNEIKFATSSKDRLEQISNPVNIVRAQYGLGENTKYYAELPLNYVSINSNANYRIKIREQTGFNYVVYDNDGTHPQYDNSKPFEVIILKAGENGYYVEEIPSFYTFTWSIVGNLSIVSTEGNTATIKPYSKFDGQVLYNAIKVEISDVGFIYIPIYFMLNRYGYKALNDWDGNSIELKENEGVILSPQVGAGKKNDDNTFSGILMGSMKEGSVLNTGILGFHHGTRTILLDSDTGKAEFGKNGAGKIIIDPSIKINGKDAGILRSGGYDIDKFPHETVNVVENNITYPATLYDLKVDNPNVNTEGMIIDLSTPQIGFGNKKFYVNLLGSLHSLAGEIGGWQITNSSLQSTYSASGGKIGGIYLSSDASSKNNKAIKVDNENENIFSVDYDGKLHSVSGDIGGWNITSATLSHGNVGMNSVSNINVSPSTVVINNSTKSKAFYANNDNFYVTHDGYLKSQSGKIANWNIGSSALTDGSVGLGSTVAPLTDFGLSENATLNFWGKSGNTYNFGVTSDGRLLSRYGTVGGWNISSATLSAGDKGTTKGGIILNSNGSISGGYNSHSWQVNQDGSATFNDITASGGKIGNWNITNGAIVDNHASTKVALKSDGSIEANEGHIGGIEIYNGGLRTNNWYIANDGRASFTNVQALSGSMGGGTISGGTLYGSGLSGCIASPDNLYTGDGDQTYKLYMYETLSASTGTFGKLIINDGLTYGTKSVSMQGIYVGVYYDPISFYAYETSSATTKKQYTINHVKYITVNTSPPGGTDIYAGMGQILRGNW